ncbi:carbohydrate-binding module family 20 domain-containing protein [Microtetraspora sp. AC03309]|uniref:carbohydrate-binding module family 20 domain-containing protein n=1 Tax=Microtetraspora sp. AC03309 TaxID=2779376 RepID=UPI001E438991|nr:carbohydrate-binding module family 20 domain-containing protein [Microtetraspora sp. AC03309]
MERARSRLRSRIRHVLLAAAVAAFGITSVAVAVAATPANAAVTLNDSVVTANLWEWNWKSVSAACTTHLGPAGFGAVQVAPPQESVSLPNSSDGVHPWYEVYQPVSYKLDSRFGNRAQFASMVTACHNAGVRVYVDAVVNHMAGTNNPGGVTGYAGTSFTGYSYPAVSYGNGDFHHPGDNCPTSGGINDWNNESQVTSCELLALSDLYTEKEYVRNKIADYLNDLIGLGVDGFRVDAVKHIKKSDFAAILGKLNNTVAEGKRPYVAQEIFDGATNDALKARAFIGNGDVLDFAYAKGVKAQFQGSISNLANLPNWNLDAPSANVFAMVTNHDLERDGATLSWRDGTDYTLANYFVLAYPHGKPSVYDSFTYSNRNQSPPADGNGFVTDTSCGGSWNCLTQSTGIKGMVGWANAAKSVTSVSDFKVVNNNVIGFHRGNRAWIGINDSGSASTAQFTTGLADGEYCDVISGAATTTGCTGTKVTVSGGQATVTIPANNAVAIHVNAKADITKVATTFTVSADLAAGQTLHVVGNVPALGGGSTTNSVALTANGGGSYKTTVELPASTVVSYKYLIKNGATVVEQEAANRSFTTPASGTATRTDTYVPPPVEVKVETTFTVSADLAAGQTLHVVGNVPALGGGDNAASVALTAAPGGGYTGVVQLPASTAVSYKYLIKEGAAVAQAEVADRTFTTPASGTATRTDTYVPPPVSDKIATTFTVTATAAADQNLYVVGDIPALGSWAPADAIKLTAQGDNLYSGVIELPKSTAVEYKFIKKTTAGAVTWESGSNRTVTTPASGTHAVTETFRGDTASQIATYFNADVTTWYGQNVFVVGNVPALGGWDPNQAIALSSADYPIWRVAVNLPPNTAVEYKYIKKNPDGAVTWESGSNRTFTTPATGTHTSNDTWK